MIDESYFGARRVRGKRGRVAYGKTKVFGMKKRGDKVYAQIVKNCSASEQERRQRPLHIEGIEIERHKKSPAESKLLRVL